MRNKFSCLDILLFPNNNNNEKKNNSKSAATTTTTNEDEMEHIYRLKMKSEAK